MKILKPLALAFLLPALGANAKSLAKTPTGLNPQAVQILAQDTTSWAQALPFDDGVKTGKLENGFQYYIRKNVEPENRVTMYLAVKVGSILETEEELGLAHFLEHMNFNGLKHFPKNELVDYLQRAGVRFGSDLNAYTSFDETVYQLPIPSDDPELLKNGLQVMRDWAQDALLDEEEIDKERGIVLEEMRGSRGAQQRMRDQYFPLMLNGSRYAERLPIGTEDIVTNFKPETIRKFHQKWYRPDLQSIIVVGDIDPQMIEQEIKRLFGDMKQPESPQDRKKYTVDLLNKNQFMVVTDPEMQYTVGQIFIKHPEEQVKTVGDYRRSLLKSLYNQMINARLGELAQSANPPFLQAGIGIGEFLGGLDNLSAFFAAKPGAIADGFKSVVRELDRVKEFGFTDSEFARAVVAMQKNNERSYTERDKRRSDSYVNEYLSHFLKDNAALSNEDSYRITKELLTTLTLAEVEAIGKQYYVEQNRDVLFLAPDKEKANLPDEAAVMAWFQDVNQETLTAYDDKVSDLPLLAAEPAKGTVVERNNIDVIGAKSWKLSNGATVVLKPTTFKNDEILIHAFGPGGTSLYADQEYFSASNAASLVNSSGLGQMTTVELQKYLSDKKANISPFIGERTQGLSGSSDKDGLKTAFEMIYGYFTAPRIEDDVFTSTISRAVSSMENRENNPSFVFSEAIQKSLYGDNVRRNPETVQDIESIDQARALSIFQERFADASDFTFMIVGSFNEAEITPLIEQYIASLPTQKRDNAAKDLKIVEPNVGFEKIVHKGKEEKAQVRLSFYGDYSFNEKENLNMDALESVLSIKLIERLREDESGVYGTGANASYRKDPTGRYGFHIGFGTSVDKYQSLIQSALDEIRKVKENGPTQVDLDKFFIEQRRQHEVNLKENRFWLSSLNEVILNDEDYKSIINLQEDIQNVTVESVKAVANKYLDETKLFKFILLPDAK